LAARLTAAAAVFRRGGANEGCRRTPPSPTSAAVRDGAAQVRCKCCNGGAPVCFVEVWQFPWLSLRCEHGGCGMALARALLQWLRRRCDLLQWCGVPPRGGRKRGEDGDGAKEEDGGALTVQIPAKCEVLLR